jgi:hypothetical protein
MDRFLQNSLDQAAGCLDRFQGGGIAMAAGVKKNPTG